MDRLKIFALSAALGAALTVGVVSQSGAQAPARPASPVINNPAPVVSGAHWHHVELNVRDPKKSVEFYTTHFDAKPGHWNGQDAVWVQKSWILLNKAKKPVDKRLNTAIWHMGWGSEDPRREYLRQAGLGATFFSPLTDLAANNGGTLDRFFFMYVQGPDRDLVELNTAAHHHFGHIHMFSADPVAAGDWWIRTFGLTGRALTEPGAVPRPPRFARNGNQVGPASSLYLDNVNMIIYPVGYSTNAYKADWKGVRGLQTTRGRLHDHIGIAVPDLAAAIAQLDRAGIKLTEPVKTLYGGQVKTAFIEGPDHVAIELIEDHSPHPPETS
jgi:catechol 2,3-dioxygenase-like lactoylglutathione lyase family enzyme